MDDFIAHLDQARASLQQNTKGLTFFAAFKPDNGSEDWDIVVSANGLNSTLIESYQIVTDALIDTLTDSELMFVASVVVLSETDIDQVFCSYEPCRRMTNVEFNGFTVAEAYFLDCK